MGRGQNARVRSIGRTVAAITCAAIALVAVPHAARAQELRGAVRDSVSRQPIGGAVLMLLDSAGSTIGRNITNERGEYRIALSAGMRRVRLIRIGFRPREAAIPAVENGIARLDLTMRSLPTMLEPIRVSAGAQCPKRNDSDLAFALLEQARAGLLATVVARDAKPGTLVRLRFDRILDDDRVTSQKVRMDSALATAKSFSSVHVAAEFVSSGFMRDSAGQQTFFGPDADVLLDQSFTSGYCFRIADSERARPTQIGLAFAAAQRRRNRVDIDGILWVDTAARALRDVEYRYVGLDPRTNSVRPGGQISFREMRNGVVLIDRWNMRLPTVENENVSIGSREEVRQWFRPFETGGELARASWPDGYTWQASLGRIEGTARTPAFRPAAGVALHLQDTDYRTKTDSAGHFEFSNLLPGPYKVAVFDDIMDLLGVEVAADTVIAVRDSVVHSSIVAKTARDYIADRCHDDRRFTPGPDSSYVIGRVFAGRGVSVDGLTVELRNVAGGRAIGVYKLGSNGVFQWCQGLGREQTILFRVLQHGSLVGMERQTLAPDITIVQIDVTLRNP
jgi:hypothetical protein